MTLRAGIRIAAILLFAAPLLATSAEAQRGGGGHGGGGGGGHFGGGGGHFGGGGHMAAPAFHGGGSGGRIGGGAAFHAARPSIPHMGGGMARPQMARPALSHGIAGGRHIGGAQHLGTRHFAAPQNAGRHQRTNVGAAARHRQQRQATSHRGLERQQRAAARSHRNATQNTQRDAARRNAVQQNATRQNLPKTTGLASRNDPNANRNLARQHNFVAAPHERGQRGNNAGRVALSNQGFAHASGRDARNLSRATFRGHFADRGSRFWHRNWFWRRHHPIVIGWAGPLFWPYAYDDFIDYTYYPYAYDTFWPYAYDDLYVDVFGPYAYGSGVYASNEYASTGSAGGGGSAAARRSRSNQAQTASGQAEVCSIPQNQLTSWPIERIADVVQPTAEQRAKLDELKDASGKAMDVLQSACPNDLPSTPTGRLEAMRVRLEAMRQAVQIVRPPLDTFYQSLSDEQKARFNAFGEDAPNERASRSASRQPDISKVCSSQAAATPTPIDRIERVLRPTDPQRAALEELDKASQEAADALKANCPQDEALTPPGRLEAMEKRLDAMLQALATVQPALEKFYGSLSDEQKAQFNRLNRRQS